MSMSVVEAAYRRKNSEDDWYAVVLGDREIGEVYRTRKGYMGFCANTRRHILGPAKRKEELGQLILAKWETFPVAERAK